MPRGNKSCATVWGFSFQLKVAIFCASIDTGAVAQGVSRRISWSIKTAVKRGHLSYTAADPEMYAEVSEDSSDSVILGPGQGGCPKFAQATRTASCTHTFGDEGN